MLRWIMQMMALRRSRRSGGEARPPALLGPLVAVLFIALLAYFVYSRLNGQG